jgi:hypothetical protein
VLIREKDGALAAALAENLIRADLNPVEEAEAILRLSELERLGTNKEVAARIGKSAGYVGDRKRLLGLPEECLPFFASGVVPLEAERNLRQIAKVSPRIAVCACELARRGKVEPHELVHSFDNVLYAVSRAKFDDPPTMIEPGSVDLEQVIEDEEKRSKLLGELMAVKPHLVGTPLQVRIGQLEIDAATAAGCLVEVEVDHGGWVSTAMFITEREVKEGREKEERRAEAARRAGKPVTEDEEKEARTSAREEAKAAKAVAERFNEGIGRKLIERRGAAKRKEHGLSRAKAVAAILLADHDGLAAAGIRLALPQLRELERKPLKSGETREKITYADRTTCQEYLWSRIEDTLQARVQKRWKEQDLKSIGLHESRHTTATWLDHAGVSPKVISEFIGHKTPEYQLGAARITLQTYTHMLPGELERARKLFDKFLVERVAEEAETAAALAA